MSADSLGLGEARDRTHREEGPLRAPRSLRSHRMDQSRFLAQLRDSKLGSMGNPSPPPHSSWLSDSGICPPGSPGWGRNARCRHPSRLTPPRIRNRQSRCILFDLPLACRTISFPPPRLMSPIRRRHKSDSRREQLRLQVTARQTDLVGRSSFSTPRSGPHCASGCNSHQRGNGTYHLGPSGRDTTRARFPACPPRRPRADLRQHPPRVHPRARRWGLR